MMGVTSYTGSERIKPLSHAVKILTNFQITIDWKFLRFAFGSIAYQ